MMRVIGGTDGPASKFIVGKFRTWLYLIPFLLVVAGILLFIGLGCKKGGR